MTPAIDQRCCLCAHWRRKWTGTICRESMIYNPQPLDGCEVFTPITDPDAACIDPSASSPLHLQGGAAVSGSTSEEVSE
jgi:hypothetical protein